MNPPPQTSNPRRPPIRWWPAIVILTIELIILAVIWLGDAAHTQDRVVNSYPVLFFGILALLLWLVLFSRLPGRARLGIFLVAAAATGVAYLSLEIKGVDGNIVPVIGFRWSDDRTFDDPPGDNPPGDATTTDATTTATPGPDDYPQLYGPNRDATLAGPRLARDWQAQPPRQLWRRQVGEAWSSFAVVGNAAITQEQRGEDEAVVRYQLKTGEQVWVHADRARFDTTVGGIGPRATPTVAGGRVYTLGATGILNCLRLDDGSRVWSRHVLEDNDAIQSEWGMTSSPLLTGDLVIVQLGLGGTSLAAYHRATGEPAWRAGIDAGSYSMPTLATVAGRRQVLIINGRSVAGHDPASGETLWREPWDLPGERITMPLPIGDDRLLVSAGYGAGSRLLRLAPVSSPAPLQGDEAGEAAEAADFTAVELWESRRLKSKFASMVLRDGVVYGLDDGVAVALDPETGERLWKRGRYGHGQLILVGDVLLIQTEKGDVVLVEATPEEHRELARLDALGSKTWNPPALSGRLLLVRNDREAACYELPVVG